VSLEGECLGFGAAGPVSLGRFQASVPKEQWDGRRLEVKSNGFIVGYRILPHGDTQAQGLFFYTDYSIPQPYDVVVAQEKPDDPNDIVENVKLARRAFIIWKWDGDETQIDNFVIYLDGKLLQWAQSDWRKTRLLLPAGCGQTYQLQVAANSGDALSVPSSPYTYVTPPCPVMAEVHFQTITASQTNDRSCYLINMVDCAPHGPCDQLSIYGEFWASSADYEVRYIGTENFSKHFTCNVDYSFKTLSDGEDTLVIPIDPLNPNLRFGTIFHEVDWFRDDNFGRVDQEIPPMTREQWSTYDQTFTFSPPDLDNTAKVYIKIRVKGFYFSE